MKRIAVVLAAVMVAVILFASCGVSQEEVDEQVSTAYNTGYSEGEEAGYTDGYQEVEESLGMTAEEAKTNLDYLASLPEPLHDPTYDELKEFLSVDQTAEEREYDVGHVVFTHTLLTRAREAGIQAYPVVAVIINNKNLVFAAFNTTDKGWIYILSVPPKDREIELEIGESYRRLNGNNPFYFSSDADAEIREIIILD